MAPGKAAFVAALVLAASGGGAFAQLDAPVTGFYADPVLPDPSPVPAHAYHAPAATAVVAAVRPSAKAQHRPACTAINPCALATPARG